MQERCVLIYTVCDSVYIDDIYYSFGIYHFAKYNTNKVDRYTKVHK